MGNCFMNCGSLNRDHIKFICVTDTLKKRWKNHEYRFVGTSNCNKEKIKKGGVT
jgi:hypothetical protein